VSDVGYDPAYFFPSTEGGSVDVTWTGRLDSDESNGSIQTKGWCWPPYAEHTKTVTVIKPASSCD
jgi:hypothetical protein